MKHISSDQLATEDFDDELDALSPASVFVTTSVKRVGNCVLDDILYHFDNWCWGEVSEAQSQHNARIHTGDIVPIHAVYPSECGTHKIHVLEFVCGCGEWEGVYGRRHMRVACFERELLLATCPCAWKDVPESLHPSRFPMLTPVQRKALDRLLHYVFDTEREHYATASESERENHVLRSAALLEGWLNDTPEPIKVVENAVRRFSEVEE